MDPSQAKLVVTWKRLGIWGFQLGYRPHLSENTSFGCWNFSWKQRMEESTVYITSLFWFCQQYAVGNISIVHKLN